MTGPDTSATPRAAVAMFCPREVDNFLPTLSSLIRHCPSLPIVVGSSQTERMEKELADWPEVSVVNAWSVASVVQAAASAFKAHVLVISDPVIVPPAFLDRALTFVDEDLRIASVSFLSNAAGYLSIPHRNEQVGHPTGRLDEVVITRVLREKRPDLGRMIVPLPSGAAVLLSWTALLSVGELPDNGPASTALAEWSLRGQRRGFLSALDPSTYVLRPFDLAPPEPDVLRHDPAVRHQLHSRHPFFPSAYDDACTSDRSPAALAHHTAVAKTLGLRVFVDGTALGPQQMGTQVQTLALIEALARNDDIRSVGVALPGPVPRYALEALSHPKIQLTQSLDLDFSTLGRADIVHRPFQPDRPLPFDAWSGYAHRTVVTVQDLIAYQIGAYQPDGEAWLTYRHHLRTAVSEADGVVVISHDTCEQVAVECLPVESDRVFVVENGTDHLCGDEVERIPAELVARGFTAGEFMLVLGANYGHKNRDLALEALAELKNRRVQQSIVLVGAHVPHGSSRRLEAARRISHDDDDVFSLPDVSDEERNWLLRHASLVLYPTSGEGFGLVPFEAARFGTPTVAVAFGPLREIHGNMPVWATSWAPTDLADAALALLSDPTVARKQIEAVLASGAEYSWGKTAEGLVDAYRQLIARPPRRLR